MGSAMFITSATPIRRSWTRRGAHRILRVTKPVVASTFLATRGSRAASDTHSARRVWATVPAMPCPRSSVIFSLSDWIVPPFSPRATSNSSFFVWAL